MRVELSNKRVIACSETVATVAKAWFVFSFFFFRKLSVTIDRPHSAFFSEHEANLSTFYLHTNVYINVYIDKVASGHENSDKMARTRWYHCVRASEYCRLRTYCCLGSVGSVRHQ